MIRRFKFEDEIYESLNCLPMAARRKLDALGVKLGKRGRSTSLNWDPLFARGSF